MRKRTNFRPISSGLREIIRKRGLTAYSAAKTAGVSADAVQRFMNAERGLTLRTVDKLAKALGLRLCRERRSSDR